MLCCRIAKVIITARVVMISRIVISVVVMRMYGKELFPDPRVSNNNIIVKAFMHTISITYGLPYHVHTHHFPLALSSPQW